LYDVSPVRALCSVVFSLLVSRLSADEGTLPSAVAREVSFDADVAPILQSRCVKCHGPRRQKSEFRVDVRDILLEGGDTGNPAIVPGKSANSRLIHLVAGVDPDEVMPPKGERLTRGEIGILRAWIDQGAAMTNGAVKIVESAKLESDHWSFQPLRARDPPKSDDPWVRGGIDAFILRKLASRDLKPSKDADRVTLIRRLHLVLHGLPPTPEEIDRFVLDSSSDAYEELVDRALESPRYGERWARHWLDLVRFGETHGFEMNRERPNAWHYRDYVIDAFNSDKPYDVFVREQIAGDAMGAEVATGFLVGGPCDQVKSPDINLVLMQRQDELADMINTTGTTFLGLTLGCARCHDHKFDPISQKDYYAIQAVLAGVEHGDRDLPPRAASIEERARIEARVSDLKRDLERFLDVARAGVFPIDDSAAAGPRARGLTALVAPAGRVEHAEGLARGQRDDPGSASHGPNISDGSYTWWTNRPGRFVASYRLLVEGRFRVWISWGSGYVTHSRDAEYVLDRDGRLETAEDQTVIAVVDQQRFSDRSGEPRNTSLFSGVLDGGVWNLGRDSVIALRCGKTGDAISSDLLVLEGVGESATDTPSISPHLRPMVRPTHNIERVERVDARYVRFTIHATNGSEPCIDELEIYSAGENVALASKGARTSSSGNYAGNAFHKLEHINDGQYGNSRSWISNTGGRGWVQIELPRVLSIDRIEWARDREGRYKDRLATSYTIEAAVEPGKWRRVASSDDRIPVSWGRRVEVAYRFDRFPAEDAERGRRALAELTSTRKRLDTVTKPLKVYSGKFKQPGPTHRLYRGEPQAKREEVTPGTIAALGTLELAKSSPERMRRVEFAEWITSRENPLTPRVIVNRLWQYTFGSAIVDTPSDFGASGTLPTHPELLDWLATELVRSDWSMKHVQRLILLSSAFRQSGRPREDALRVDVGSRLLWRFPPRRLEAEAIRDSMLRVSGVLDLSMGGPGFSGFEIQLENVRHFFPKKSYGPADWRRMVYMTKVRQEQDSVFGVFDCPDGNQVMPKRSSSTTPLQALSLFNSTFVLQQAALLARRLEKEASDGDARVRRGFRLVFGRAAVDDEARDSVAFVEEHGLDAFCRALFNANEFVFVP